MKMERRDFLKGAVAAAVVGVGAGLVVQGGVAEGGGLVKVGVRRGDERGYADHGWLQARHTFSFSDYRDAAWSRFRSLRVINEDRIAAGGGFPMHPHKDMEIITYMLSGSLEHKDSMGNGGVVRPGEIQYMGAGTGVHHSEFNHAQQTSHLLQIWLVPAFKGMTPSYDSRTFGEERRNDLRLIASGDGRMGAMPINQDVELYASVLDAERSLTYRLREGRATWLQLAKGELVVNGARLAAGDAAYWADDGAQGAATFDISTASGAEFLLFDLV
jgi:quercetin 2,3-dioxygenase